MITELVEYGNLVDFSKSYRLYLRDEDILSMYDDTGGREIGIFKRLFLILYCSLADCAAGMHYLSQNKIGIGVKDKNYYSLLMFFFLVHRDLAARNVLVDSGRSPTQMSYYIAKISDLGLSRSTSKQGPNEYIYEVNQSKFPVRWYVVILLN